MKKRIRLTLESGTGDNKEYYFSVSEADVKKYLCEELEPCLLFKNRKGQIQAELYAQKDLNENNLTGDKCEESMDASGKNTELLTQLRKIYSSDRLSELRNSIAMAADKKINVILTGETGVGKEYIARMIHKYGAWADKPFVAVNCGAIPENLLESELFGYEEGAFTGAKKSGKPGKFELAEDGIIFLDEISEIPVSLQVKLLRVLQERQFERVGGIKPIKMNAKIISATNRNLEQAIQENQFRLDLYYRVGVLKICLPPLREHKEDLIHIAKECIKVINQYYSLDIRGISEEAAEILLENDWTGNARELANVLEVAANMAVEGKITPCHLPQIKAVYPKNQTDTSLNRKIKDIERDEIKRALEESGGNRIKAAELLNMSRSTFYYKLNKYEID